MSTTQALRNDSERIQADLSKSGYITMDKYNHIHTNLESIDTDSTSTNLGKSDDTTKRICIASDDVLITNLKNSFIDKRLNTNGRYKVCGKLSTAPSGAYSAVGLNFTNNYTSLSPPQGTLLFLSSSVDDNSEGTGCQSVYLKYIDSAGDEKEETVNTDGTNSVSIGTNVREIIEFKCAIFGSSKTNQGAISLLNNPSSTILGQIDTNLNNGYLVGIDIPQNGYTLLKSLILASMEATNTNINVELKLVLIEYLSPTSFVYRIIFTQRCQFQKSIIFDLSQFPAIKGSRDSNTNFSLYPVIKSINDSDFDTTVDILLSAINVD